MHVVLYYYAYHILLSNPTKVLVRLNIAKWCVVLVKVEKNRFLPDGVVSPQSNAKRCSSGRSGKKLFLLLWSCIVFFFYHIVGIMINRTHYLKAGIETVSGIFAWLIIIAKLKYSLSQRSHNIISHRNHPISLISSPTNYLHKDQNLKGGLPILRFVKWPRRLPAVF